jgi:hypothetical protein
MRLAYVSQRVEASFGVMKAEMDYTSLRRVEAHTRALEAAFEVLAIVTDSNARAVFAHCGDALP